jgi:hypothetical protein
VLLLFVGLVLLPEWIALARDDDGEVAILPRWKQGEKLRFEMVKTRVKSRAGKEVETVTARTLVDIEVSEAGKDGYVVRWTYGETRLDNPEQNLSPIVRSMSNLLKGIHLDIEIDADGNMTGLRNWQAVRKLADKIATTLLDEVKGGGLDDAARDRLGKQLRAMLSTKEKIEQLCFREAQVFFLPVGHSFRPGKPLELDDELPNPLGGEAIPTKTVFALKSHEKATGRVAVTWKQSADPNVTARVMEKTLRDLAKQTGAPVPNGEMLKAMQIEDSAEYTLDRVSGWPLNFTHTRTMSTGPDAMKDTLTFTRKP